MKTGPERWLQRTGATSPPDSGLVPLTVARRTPPTADDVEIAIEFCGLCHSDVHATRGEWRVPPTRWFQATRS